MTLDLSPARFVLFANAAVLIALALFVASRRPRRRANLHFAAWASGLGLAFASYFIIDPSDGAYPAIGYTTAVFLAVAAASHVGLVLYAPRPLAQRRLLVWPSLLLGAYFLVQVPLLARSLDWLPLTPSWRADWVRVSAHLSYLGIAWAAVLLLAVRGLTTKDERARRQYAFFGAAVATFPAWLAGWFAISRGRFTPDNFYTVFALLCALGISAIWIVASRHGTASRACRNAALYIPGAYLGGMLYGAFVHPDGAGRIWLGWALVATIEVLLITYAVLREQVLGLDVKVKWTLKQSTIAGIFLAVIFVVSEGAQLAFGQERAWIGLVAGGALVFALAPLQRFADRVSDKAMPGVKAVSGMTKDQRAHTYRNAAASAWSDGAIDVSERALLDRFRESLSLSAEEAHRIESEAAIQFEAGPETRGEP